MSNNITETIVNAVNAKAGYDVSTSYGPYIDAAAEGLLEREYDITEAVIEKVTQHFGVSRDDVMPYVEEVGLSVRPQPEPEVEEEPKTEDDRLTAIEKAVAGLAESVGELKALADRHLGSRF